MICHKTKYLMFLITINTKVSIKTADEFKLKS